MKKDIVIIRRWLIFFAIALFISGLTAIPAETELAFLSRCFPPNSRIGSWLDTVYLAVLRTNQQYPYLAYGYDWLAFAHFILTILLIGPIMEPVRNKWVVEFSMIACLLIIPFALVVGQLRGIPFWWRLIDCSFGLIGLIPLSFCLKRIVRLEEASTKTWTI